MKKEYRATTCFEISPREKNNAALARKIAAEGICLLKNSRVLPLNETKVALYGIGAVYTVRGGTGSGDVHPRYDVSVWQGLKNAGLTVVSEKWLFQEKQKFDEQAKQREDKISNEVRKIRPFDFAGLFEIPARFPPQLNTSVDVGEQYISDETDTAIYILSRQAGEGKDRRAVKGDYFMTDEETQALQSIRKHYKNVVLVINAGSIMDLSFTDQIPMDAILYMAQAGMEGGNALADILTGKVNPSGCLTDTWALNWNDYPSAATFSYLNGDLEQEDYQEGIYVGYRYFDTYQVRPRYPFGYGLSYTSFNLKQIDIEVLGDIIRLKVVASNQGGIAGKCAVQVYASCPKGKMHKEFQRLVSFCKSDNIEPDKTQTLELSFLLRSLASFEPLYGAYILEPGRYQIKVGFNSAESQVVADLLLDKEVITEYCTCITDANQIKEMPLPRQTVETQPSLKCIKINADAIETIKSNTFNIPQPEREALDIAGNMSDAELLKMVVGVDPAFKAGQFTNVPGAAGHTAANIECGVNMLTMADGPAGLRLTSEYHVNPNGSFKCELFEPYMTKSAWWMKLVGIGTQHHSKKAQAHYQYATAWPVGTLLAMTFDIKLAKEMGKAVSAEMEEFGVNIWLSPGMNIHRNPLCGRNFEYFSEDPLLSGKIAAAITRGVQINSSCAVSVKHFACNNQEDNREYVSSNINERALREIYLKGFEIAVKEAAPKTVMSSYNKIYGVYTASHEGLLTKILRQEWQFSGLIMSDWDSCREDRADPVLGVKAGNNLFMPGNAWTKSRLMKALCNGELSRKELEICAARVIALSIQKDK